MKISACDALTIYFSDYCYIMKQGKILEYTVVPGFRVLGFSVLPGFRALKAGDGAWSVHKTLFGFRAPLFQLYINKILIFLR